MATYRLPFEDVPGWGVATGNFDDPSSGHGLGQPFAWDFTFPVNGGAKILAARAGTVVNLRGDSTKVLPKGVDDEFWGPGNYVLIEHCDRTIAAYDHMQPNSLKVTAGQYVDQGAWIGNVGNTGSTSGGVVHLHFECHSWYRTGSTGPGSIFNDIGGPSLLVHLEDKKHRSWRPIKGDKLSPHAPMSRQDGWRCCVKCGGLYLSYWSVVNRCPDGGTHAFNESGDYVLPNNAANSPGQAGWKQCHKCAGVFFTGHPNSKCPDPTAGQGHDPSGSGAYSIINNVANDPGQHEWRWCDKCQGLWYEHAWASKCPKDGKAHSKNGSGDYALEVNPQDVQRNWRKCIHCQGIYLASNGSGVCQAQAGGHDPGGSGSYLLCDDVSPVNAGGTQQAGWQGGWRYCKKCGHLWMGLNSPSHCPAGGAHTLAGSGEYWLRFNNPPGLGGAEAGWRWCHKCQSLWSGGNGSRCPADNQQHSQNGSGDYVLMNDNFLWHWCEKCHGLWLGDNGSTGVCQGGAGGHSLIQSSGYLLVCDHATSAVPGSPGTQPPGWQEGWRFCTKCQLLWMGQNPGSHCPAGGAHSHAAQDGAWEHANFVLRFSGNAADAPGQQTKWKWCHKCQSLWHSKAGSKCAADGLQHDDAGSGDYMLDHDF